MGVDIQVVGPMPMHRYWAEPDLALGLATVTNEAVAAHCADGEGRLAGLGTIPLQHPDLAVPPSSSWPRTAALPADLHRPLRPRLGEPPRRPGLRPAPERVPPRDLVRRPRLHPQALRHLVDAVSAGQVVLGTDHPFDMGVTDPVARAEAVGLPAADLTAILSGNAATLFGLGPCHAPRSNYVKDPPRRLIPLGVSRRNFHDHGSLVPYTTTYDPRS